MKAGREHRVPLSSSCHGDRRADGRNPDRRSCFCRPAAAAALVRPAMGALVTGATVHGLRASFRDWCGEETRFPREIAEPAFAHATGDATERAYRRGDALEKRRGLMEAWASFCEPGAGNVIALVRSTASER